MTKFIGPFKITHIESTTGGGHGGYRNLTLKRPGFSSMEIYMEFDEYKELELGDEINISLSLPKNKLPSKTHDNACSCCHVNIGMGYYCGENRIFICDSCRERNFQ